jgi:glyoxylase I family protein
MRTLLGASGSRSLRLIWQSKMDSTTPSRRRRRGSRADGGCPWGGDPVCSGGQRGVRLLERCALEKVVGIGGMFFRAENPEVLREWYADNLGVVDSPGGAWLQEEGPTVFAPFSRDTGYFGSQDQQFMVNFRVRWCARRKRRVWVGSPGSSIPRATAWNFGSPSPAIPKAASSVG